MTTRNTTIYPSKAHPDSSSSKARYSRLQDIESEDQNAYSYSDNPAAAAGAGVGVGTGAGENDADVYDYTYHDYDYGYPYDYDDDDVNAVNPANPAADEGADLRIQGSSFDNGEQSMIYDPASGAYDQMLDFATGTGGYEHHRERLTEEGIYQARDVQRREDGSRHVHREYENPATGTKTVREYER